MLPRRENDKNAIKSIPIDLKQIPRIVQNSYSKWQSRNISYQCTNSQLYN